LSKIRDYRESKNKSIKQSSKREKYIKDKYIVSICLQLKNNKTDRELFSIVPLLFFVELLLFFRQQVCCSLL